MKSCASVKFLAVFFSCFIISGELSAQPWLAAVPLGATYTNSKNAVDYSSHVLALAYLKKGVRLLEGDWGLDVSRHYLAKSLEHSDLFKDYISYYISKSYFQEHKWTLARVELENLAELDLPSGIKYEALKLLSQVYQNLREEEKEKQTLKKLKYFKKEDSFTFKLRKAQLYELSGNLKKACGIKKSLYRTNPSKFPYVIFYEKDALGLPDCALEKKDVVSRWKRMKFLSLGKKLKKEFQQTLAASLPENQKYWEGQYFYLDGDLEKSKKVADALVADQKDLSQEELDFIVNVYSQEDLEKSAKFLLKKHNLASNKNKKSDLFFLGHTYFQAKNFKKSSLYFRRFLKSYPRSSRRWDVYRMMGTLHYLEGRPKSARFYFRKLSSHPDQKLLSRYWIGMSYLKSKNYKRAKTYFERIVKKDGLWTYYTLLAQARLKSMSTVKASKLKKVRFLASLDSLSKENPKQELFTNEEDISYVVKGFHLSLDEMRDWSPTEELSFDSFFSGDLDQVLKRALLFSEQKGKEFKRWAQDELNFAALKAKEIHEAQVILDLYTKAEAYNRGVRFATYGLQHVRKKVSDPNSSQFWRLAYPQFFQSEVKKAFAQQKNKATGKKAIDSLFVYSIIRAESLFKPDAESVVGARGLMQIMGYTAEKLAALEKVSYEFDDLWKPQYNIRLGVSYLSRLSRQLDGQLPLIAAAYNAGPHRVGGWLERFPDLSLEEFIEVIPYSETRSYVKNVMRNYYIYNSLYNESKLSINLFTPLKLKRVTLKGSFSENWQ